MLKLGLTGGIGCGKSTAVDAFRALGIPIIDADQISRNIVKPNSKALTELSGHFGKHILEKDGSLNRETLKDIIFENDTALKKVEDIFHPRIKQEIKNQIKNTTENSTASYLIVDIPLLVEKNYQNMFDRIIVVDCTPAQQIERVSKRDNLSLESIENIMKVQANRDTRNSYATDILDNSGTLEELQEKISTLHQEILTISTASL